MVELEQFMEYRTTPHALLERVIGDLAAREPLVLGDRPVRLGEIVQVALNPGERRIVLTDKPEVLAKVDRAVKRLRVWLEEERVVYGVNTGYGATGIYSRSLTADSLSRQQQTLINGLMVGGAQEALPEPVARGAMLLRVVSCVQGVSGLRVEVMKTLLKLLNEGVTPIVPLKGSLTASGDLVPLAYIAAAIVGVPDPYVQVSWKGQRRAAHEVLAELGIEPVKLEPKEGLALVNATSVAASNAAIASVTGLNAYLLEILTAALGVCVVGGSMAPFHPFVTEVKPHAGQDYANRLIFNLLSTVSDSLLPKRDLDGYTRADDAHLCQLTYPFRCIGQHLAPEFDAILGILNDLSIEINGVSDNPLICASNGHDFAISSGNFLGATIARDMDRLKISLHSIARLAHAQFKFLVRGVERQVGRDGNRAIVEPFIAVHLIPTCTHPAEDMGFQGVEVFMDALLSEMNAKVAPHSTVYLSAERENQAIVAMGLAAARAASDIGRDLAYCLAGQLMALCQVFDLTTLDPELIQKQQQKKENARVDNPRAAELGLLRPLYDFIRVDCGVPTFFTSTRMHTYLSPVIERIENFSAMRRLLEPCLLAAWSLPAYSDHAINH